MKNSISSFIVHLSSFALLLAIGNEASAQMWIIDGQQTQVLKLEVSDPQALHTDGSREMTAPIYFPPSLTATSGLFRAYYAPEGQTEEFFIINGDDEYVQLSSGCGTLRVGDTFVHGGGLYSGLNSAAISFDEKLLSGGWMVEDVPNHSGAVMSRGYADARYLRQGVDLTAPLAFASSYTATGGMFRAYIPWAEQDSDMFVFNVEDECLDLSADQNAALRIGGVMINQSGISGYGVSAGFEDNTLFGPWKLNQVVDNSLALLNRSYADSRYVMNGQDSVALGLDTAATGDYSIAAGYKNLASGKYSVAFNGGVDPDEPEEGVYTNVASGIGSAVFGWGNVASGNGAVAFGWESVASGNWSLAAGSSDAIGEFSTALGEVCDASGSDSFAAGYNTSATGSKSVAFGHSTTASALGSFANGFASSASGNYSTAWGSYCDASGLNSIALGTRAKALHPGSVVIADSQNADVTSATNDTFTVRAQNGVYLQTDAIHSSGPLVFDSTLTATNGALQIYATDSEDHLGFFKTLSFQDGLQFSTAHSASLFFGMNSSDGLLIGPDSIMQLGYNTRIEFETGTLSGGTGEKWHVSEDPTEASGIVNKGYADGRYLLRTTGITTNRVIQAGDTLVISNGVITAIY
jgi:hypothetical protein